MSRIGVVGLGIMGFEAAKCLLKDKHSVFGYDPFDTAAKRAAQLGVNICRSPEEIASKAEIILIIVPGPKESEEVIFGNKGIINNPAEGLLIANMSTVDPATNRRLANKLSEKGIILIDTPVLGLPSGAGKWSFPVGARTQDFERFKPVLRSLAGSDDRIFHVGEVGDGNKLKLLNNLMFGAITSCTAEIMALAKKMGLSQRLLFEVALAANAGTISNLYKALAIRIIEENQHDLIFSVQLLRKDNALALNMAKEHDVSLMLAETVDRINKMGCASGYGSMDVSTLWKMFYEQW